jgi:excisionase family DNA binding protein
MSGEEHRPDEILAEREARVYLRVSRSTFRRLRERGALRAYRLRGTKRCVRFKRADLDRLLEEMHATAEEVGPLVRER